MSKPDCLLSAKVELEKIFDGNLKKHRITPFEAHEIAYCYNEIVKNGKVDTIYEGVKNFFENQHFNIAVKGVGWKISLQHRS